MLTIGNIKFSDFPVIMAPMEDVTDAAFRGLCKRCGADLVFTEFIASEGLIRDVQKSVKKLMINDEERPVGIQIFGNNEYALCKAAEAAAEANPDCIDLNWGCPVKKVVKKMCGSGMLQDPAQLVALTKAVVKHVSIPVTVKTRLGWDETNKPIVSLAEQLQDVGIAALTIHGRTRSQLYSGEADWTLIGKIKENPRIFIPIFGNGDIVDAPTALEKRNRYGVDGIMIGRAAMGNPFIFREIKSFFATGIISPPPTLSERIAVCREHLLWKIKIKDEKCALLEMRSQYAPYFKGIPNFKPFRVKLVQAETVENVLAVLEEIEQGFIEKI
ncbi:MAG: tRNA dihydrouridine synthase DusB [Bacteroidales bacterium]|nr:tRNA dihydrouridine synthase DusB [Bacteroidales bacterium]